MCPYFKLLFKAVMPASPLSFPLLPSCHLGNGDFHHATIFHPFKRDIGRAKSEATIKRVKGDLPLTHVFNHFRPAIANHTVAVYMARIPCMFSHLPRLTGDRETNLRIPL